MCEREAERVMEVGKKARDMTFRARVGVEGEEEEREEGPPSLSFIA